MGARLELMRDGTVTRVLPVGGAPISVGAHVANQVVIDAPGVSAQHAVVSPGPQGLVVLDLDSTNGTFVNGERVEGPTELSDGDRIGLGERIALRVRIPEIEAPVAYAVRELDSGLLHPLRRARTVFGTGDRCQVPLAGGPKRAATMVVHDDEVWLGTVEEEREIELGERFTLEGQVFVLEAVQEGRQTVRQSLDEDEELPYQLRVDLDAAGGPTALIREPDGSREHLVTAENRATLLYVLAKKRREDLDAEAPELTAGWMDDEEVAVAIWGRAAWEQSASRFSVLVHRVRKELDEADFDPWFIEKRRGATRVALHAVEVA